MPDDQFPLIFAHGNFPYKFVLLDVRIRVPKRHFVLFWTKLI